MRSTSFELMESDMARRDGRKKRRGGGVNNLVVSSPVTWIQNRMSVVRMLYTYTHTQENYSSAQRRRYDFK